MNNPIDITGTQLVTKRLLLRPFAETDLNDFYAYACVDGVGQMAGWLPHESIEASSFILQRFIEGKHTFALEYQGKVIGSVGIEEYNEEEFPEFDDEYGRAIGYVLAKDYWGKGLMPEAVSAVISWLFETQNLDFILCGYFEGNLQSKRVQEKCGFQPYKESTFTTYYGQTYKDMYNLLRKEKR